jgi:hypothetical protein
MSLSTHDANRQYSLRPKDERFKTLADIHAAALDDAKRCASASVKLGSLEAVTTDDGNIALRGKDTGSVANLTHWSFSQLAKVAGAPAGYLRESLPPSLAVQCLNHGLSQAAAINPNDDAQLYLRRNGHLTIRAITKEYVRLHDATVIERLQQLQAVRPGLDLPPVWEGGKGGAYRGDRDMFVTMVDGGSIVDDPTIGFGGSNGTMYRGIIARNSEVGAAQIEILTFLFRGICGNHNIWGVENETIRQSRHVGKVADRFEDMLKAAVKFFDRPASEDVERIKALGRIELGKDKPEVVTIGRQLGMSETQATEAYDIAEAHEPNPRSIWGYAQGITRMSQAEDYQDQRFALDLLAAKLLRRKVAA